MEQKNQAENKEYQFIREKVVSRRKSRLKKMALSFGFTVFLAAVFGVVARTVFLCADGPIRRLLGMENEPSAHPTPTARPMRPNLAGTVTPSPEQLGPDPGQLTPGAPPQWEGNPTGNKNPSGMTGMPTPGTEAPTGTATPSGTTTPSETAVPSITGSGTGEPSGGENPSGTEAPTGDEDPPGEENPPGTGSGTGEPSGTENPPGTGEPDPTPTPELSFAEQYAKLFAGIQEIAQEVQHSLVTITVFVNGIDWLNNPYETESRTTGIVVGQSEEELLILVNLDRIQAASRISLTVNRENYEAELWSYDRDYNIAIVRIDTEELPEQFLAAVKTAVFGESATLSVGMPILALGNPNGYVGSMDFGMVTSRQSVYYITDNSVDLFNTSTADSEDGDGVIVNLSGEIVGIITRTMKSGFDESMCTAVGITKLKGVIERLAAGQGQVYFGVRGEDMPQAALAEQNLSNGIYIMEVETNSPAFEAGIKTGDIIMKVDNNFIYSFSGFNAVLNLRTPGTEMKITLWRTVRMKAEEIEVTVVLGERNEMSGKE